MFTPCNPILLDFMEQILTVAANLQIMWVKSSKSLAKPFKVEYTELELFFIYINFQIIKNTSGLSRQFMLKYICKMKEG